MIADLRHAVRLLARQPVFTVAAMLTLAAGIAATVTVFTLYSGLWFRPLPEVEDVDQLVTFRFESARAEPSDWTPISEQELQFLREQAQTVTGLSLLQSGTFIFAGAPPLRVLGCWITPEGFAALGARTVLGRAFEAGEGAPGREPVALLGHDLWQRQFGADPEVVGRVLPLNGENVRIIGVMAPGFRFPVAAEVWMPFRPTGGDPLTYGLLPSMARIVPGATLEEVRAEVARLGPRLPPNPHLPEADMRLTVLPYRDAQIPPGVRVVMNAFLVAVALVLLIASTNVANLLLARNGARTREWAVRAAIGASPARLRGQILLESGLLALGGGLLGSVLAVWCLDAVLESVRSADPGPWDWRVDWRVALFTLLVVAAVGLGAGAVPASQFGSLPIVPGLQEGGIRGSHGSRRAGRVRRALVFVQVLLATVLLVVAGLVVRAFVDLAARDPGFETEGILTFRVGLPRTLEPDPDRVAAFFSELGASLVRQPGVEAAAITTQLPGTGDHDWFRLAPDPRPGASPPPSDTEESGRLFRALGVSRGFADTFGLRLLAGRFFDETDVREAPFPALVLMRRTAQRLTGVEDPAAALGRRLTIDASKKADLTYEVVGVVDDLVFQLDEFEDPFSGLLYCTDQAPTDAFRFASVALRVRGDPADYLELAKASPLRLRPDAPNYFLATMGEVFARETWGLRFIGVIFSTFGALALLLAMLGVYGLVSFTVFLRTPEIGVRTALGANPAQIVRLVGWEGGRLVVVGVALGLGAAYLAAQAIAGVIVPGAFDPVTYTLLPVVVLLAGAVALYGPARAAARLDPSQALRET